MSELTADLEQPSRSRPSALILALLAGIAVVVLVADQLVKYLVVTSLPEGRTVDVLGGFLQFTFVRNSGAAFSFASGQTWIFTIAASAVTVAIIVVARRIHSVAWAAVFGLALGGTLGNLSDRLFREPGFGEGHVIDYISTPWLIPAIYNIADMAIVSAAVVFVLLTLMDVGLDGVRRRRPRRTERSRNEAVAPEGESGA